jgi:Family of unknown function (DUF5681)
MGNYEIGYGRPPKHTRFKKGVCPNPRGRGKSQELPVAKIMDGVLNAPVEFRDQGKLKKETRIAHKRAEALKGDVGSALQLLTLRARALRHGDSGPMIIRVTGGFRAIIRTKSDYWEVANRAPSVGARREHRPIRGNTPAGSSLR